MAKVKWYGEQVQREIEADMKKRLNRAGVYIQGEVRRSINRGNPRGNDPSLPGEPPKKVTARLFRSIAYDVMTFTRATVLRFGSNVEYARRLELGFSGRDKIGRYYRQEPRPYLRRMLADSANRRRIAMLLTGRA